MIRVLRGILFLGATVILPACGSQHGHPLPTMLPGPWARTIGSPLGDGPSRDVVFQGSSYAAAGVFSNNQACLLRLGLDGSILSQKAYGGPGTWFSSLAAVPAGGMIASGYTNTAGAGGYDAWVVRMADDGSILWQKTYGGTGDDYGYRVLATSDGGFILLCTSTTFTGTTVDNLWILKLNPDGSVAWQKTYSSAFLTSQDIVEVPGGGYLVTAGTSGDAWVLRLNADGTVAWQNRYGTAAFEQGLTCTPTSDGGFLIVADTQGSNYLAWLLKLDGTGALVWQKTYAAATTTMFTSCEEEPDGSFLLSGAIGAIPGSTGSQVWAVHVLADGSLDWNRQFPSAAQAGDGVSLRASPFGGLLLLGETASYGAGSYDAWILHLNDDGTCPPLDSTSSITVSNTTVSPAATATTVTTTSVTPANTAVSPSGTSWVTMSEVP